MITSPGSGRRRWAPHGSGPSAGSKGWARGGWSASPTTLSQSWSTAPAPTPRRCARKQKLVRPMGLRLAEEKTRVVHIDEGFDFLSVTIRRMRKRGHVEAVRLHVPVPEGHPGHQGQDLSQDVQVNPEPGPGCAHPEHQPDPGRVGELPPPRSLQGRIQRDRPSCMGPDHALAKAEIQTRELPPRNASTAPPLLRARDLAVRSQRSQVHRRVSRTGHSLPLPRQQNTGPVGTPAGPGNQLTPAGKTRGAPGAVRVARRVRWRPGETHQEQSWQGAPVRPNGDRRP